MTKIMTCNLPYAVRSKLLTPFLGVILLAGCKPAQPENGGSAQGPQQSTSDSPSLGKPPYLGTVAGQSSSSAAKNQIGLRRPPAQETTTNAHVNATIPVKARHEDPAPGGPLSVSAFLDRPVSPGQRVQVTGTCLDQFHARGSAGPPPVSRSDWQLASGTQVVYVVGRMPTSCATEAATSISATVGIDTTMIAGTSRPRRYLVIPRQ
jgi:hypothetical protein